MKTMHRALSKLLTAYALLVGAAWSCGGPALAADAPHNHDHDQQQHEQHEHGPAYREGRGLDLPEVTKQAIGLELAEVTEEPFTPTLDIGFQVYRGHEERTGSGAAQALLSARVPTETARLLSIGVAVELRGGGTGRVIHGRLDRMDRIGAAQDVELVVAVDEANASLDPGDFLRGTVKQGKVRSSTAIPESALLTTIQGTFVYVVNEEYLLRTAVKTGARVNGKVEILEGVYPGDQVVIKPVLDLWLTELQLVKGGQGCAHGH